MNPRRTLHSSLVVASILALAACKDSDRKDAERAAPSASPATAASINQGKICETKQWRTVNDCAVGQKVGFFPESFGNAQLPVLFAAVNCDLRYSVVITTGAVTCIYQPLKHEEAAEPARGAASGSAGAAPAASVQ